MSNPTWRLETPRLFITHFLPSNDTHASFLLKLYNSPLFIAGEGKTGIDTLEKAHKHLSAYSDRQAKYGFGQYLVWLKALSSSDPSSLESRLEDAKPIGNVSLMIGDYTVPDVGFAILEEENGKGYATEAGKEIVRHAVEDLGLSGVLGFTGKGNARSRKVLEKIGLEERGVRKLVAFGGNESVVFALPGMGDLKEYGIDD